MAQDLELKIKAKDEASKTVDKVTGSVEKLDKETEKATTTTGGLWKSFAVGQIAANLAQKALSAVVDVIGSSIKMAIDAEEAHSKFGVVYQKVATEASAAAKDLADNWGLSKNAAEEMLSATGDLLTGLGMNSKVALDLSTKTQKLAIDLASFTNYSGGAKGASEALTKAMLGERESLKSLGIVITEEMVKNELVIAGKDKYVGMALQQAKAEATLKIAMEQSKNAMGDYERTQDSTANSVKRITALWDDMKVEIGSAIVETIGPLLQQFKKWFEENRKAVMTFARDAIEYLKRFANYLYEVGKVVWEVVKVTKTLIDWTITAIEKAGMLLTSQGMLHKAIRERLEKQKKAQEEMNKVDRTSDLVLEEKNQTLGKGIVIIDLVAEAQKKEREEEEKAKEATNDFSDSIKKNTTETQKNAIAVYEAKKADEAWKEELKGINILIDSLSTGEIGITTAFKLNNDVVSDNTFKLNQNKTSLFNLSGATWDETKANQENTKTVDDNNVKWTETVATLKMVENAMDAVDGLFSALGIDISGVTKQVNNGISAFVSFGDGLKSIAAGGIKNIISGVTSMIGAIAAGIQIVLALGKAIAKIFKGDGVGEAIERENKWMNLTKDQIKQLKELEKQYNSTHAATSDMLDQFIRDADITTDNFDQWAQRTRDILADLDQGTMTLAQTQKEMGDAFTELITKAKELGTEGSATLIAMFDDLDNRGIKVAEVQEYINEQLAIGLEGYKAMKAATLENADAMAAFGNLNVEVYEEMIRYENQIAEQQVLVNAINGAQKALEGLSNTQKLTEEQFDSFATSASTAYDKLIKGGMDEQNALKTIAPMLAKLSFLQSEYGYTIDATTQKRIDDAKAAGLIAEDQRSDSQKMIDLLSAIATKLGAEIPGALDKTAKGATEAFNKATEGANEFGDALDKATKDRDVIITTKYKNKGEIPAAKGFEGWVAQPTRFLVGEAGPEYVSVTPKNKVGKSNPKMREVSVQQNIYINGVNLNKDEIVQAIKIAIPNNEQGLKTIFKQAMAEGY